MTKRAERDQAGKDEDATFAAWLATAGGARVTGVRGDAAWNRNVALGATETALGIEPGAYRPQEER